jgi:hypothetical protein
MHERRGFVVAYKHERANEMRKVEKEMIQAMAGKGHMQSRNTMVTTQDDLTRVFLHGNEIATYDHGLNMLTMTLAGWNTVTTRSRLNAIATACNVAGWTQRDFEPFHGSERVDESDVIVRTLVQTPALPSWVR